MSQRTWQAPPGPSALPRAADSTGSGQPGEPQAKPGPADGTDTGTAKKPATAAGVRLTGRGALVVVFALCLLGLAVSGWLHWGMLTGLVFIAASCLAAARTQRTDLLVVAVSTPALFLIALIITKALGSSGNVLSTLEGTLITLANTAPWLIAGTLLSLIVAFCRGMWDNVRTLRKDLRGDPIRRAN